MAATDDNAITAALEVFRHEDADDDPLLTGYFIDTRGRFENWNPVILLCWLDHMALARPR